MFYGAKTHKCLMSLFTSSNEQSNLSSSEVEKYTRVVSNPILLIGYSSQLQSTEKCHKSQAEIKCWQAKRGSYARANVFPWPYSLALTSISPRDFPFLYETIGGSLYISLSDGWFWIKCHLLIRIFLRLDTAGWNVVTKGRIFLRTLCRCWSTDFLALNLTSDVILSTKLSG